MDNIFLKLMSVGSIILSMVFIISSINVFIQCIKDKSTPIKPKLIFLGLLIIPISMLSACVIGLISCWF